MGVATIFMRLCRDTDLRCPRTTMLLLVACVWHRANMPIAVISSLHVHIGCRSGIEDICLYPLCLVFAHTCVVDFRSGIEDDLVELLGKHSPIPVTYAGGVRSIEDLERVRVSSSNNVCVQMGGSDVRVLCWNARAGEQ